MPQVWQFIQLIIIRIYVYIFLANGPSAFIFCDTKKCLSGLLNSKDEKEILQIALELIETGVCYLLLAS